MTLGLCFCAAAAECCCGVASEFCLRCLCRMLNDQYLQAICCGGWSIMGMPGSRDKASSRHKLVRILHKLDQLIPVMKFPIASEGSPALPIWIPFTHEELVRLPQAPELGLSEFILADIRMKPASRVVVTYMNTNHATESCDQIKRYCRRCVLES